MTTWKAHLAALGVGIVLGGLATFFVLAKRSAEWEAQANRAEAAAAVFRDLAAREKAGADSARAAADSILAAIPEREPPRTRVERILATVPDSQAIDSLVAVIGELDIDLTNARRVIALRDQEIARLRKALALTEQADSTTGEALADRPTAPVAFDWRPDLGADLFVSYQAPPGALSGGFLCVGAGPTAEIGPVAAQVYGAFCSTGSDVLRGIDRPAVEARVGVRAVLTIL